MTAIRSIGNDRLTVTIADHGAETHSLRDRAGREYLWQGDPAHWSGRAPVLFPIVGAAPRGRIAVDGHQAEMAQHGFARRSLFACTAATAARCRHELTPTEAIRAQWPFDFVLAVTHALDGPALTVTAEVTNRDRRAMPFGFGFHPAFAWPLPGAEGRAHRVTLDNRAEPARTGLAGGGLLAEGGLPSPFRAGVLDLDPGLFADGALIFPTGAGTGLAYGAQGGPALRFAFDGLPNLALWTKPGAPFLCIEPWHGMAARTGAGPGIAERPFTRHLAPGETARFAFTVTVS